MNSLLKNSRIKERFMIKGVYYNLKIHFRFQKYSKEYQMFDSSNLKKN